MSTFWIYPIYTGVLALILYSLVPREFIRSLFIYGVIFGSVFDTMVILIIKLLGVGGYLNYGPFECMSIPFFPLIAWFCFFILYLYFLPESSSFIYIYPVLAAIFSTFFSNVLQNLGIFKWNNGLIVIPFLIYITWYAAATWAYLKSRKVS